MAVARSACPRLNAHSNAACDVAPLRSDLAQPAVVDRRPATRRCCRAHSCAKYVGVTLADVVISSPVAMSCSLPYRARVCSSRYRGCVTGAIRNDQGLVDEVREQVDHVAGCDRPAGADLFRGVERAPAGEHRQSIEQAALAFEEKLVAPVNDCTQRLLTRHRGARATRQQAEAIVEPVHELVHGQRPYPYRGELDGEGDAVEPPADLGDDRLGVVR